MRLEIKNNILYRCILDAGEAQIELPDSIEYIEADAFAEIPSGQLKHLMLNYGLKGFSSNAFRGLDKLETLTVYAYSFENRGNYLLDSQNLLRVDTLLIWKNIKGNYFALSAMLEDGYPRHLIVDSDVDVRYCGRANCEGDFCGFDGVKELTLYVKDAIRWDPYLFTNTQMCFQLKKLRLVNCRYEYSSEEDVLYETKPSLNRKGQLRPIKPKILNWQELPQWTPCFFHKTEKEAENSFPGRGLFELKGLEEVILPEGLTDIDDEMFSNCPLLRKIVLPPTVEWIGKNAFRGNSSLQTVTLSAKTLENIQTGVFAECPKLKKINIYDEQNPYRIVQKVSKQELWKRVTLNHAVTVAREFWPQLAEETDAEMAELHVDNDICIEKMQFLLQLIRKIKMDKKKLAFKELTVLNLIQNILYRDI